MPNFQYLIAQFKVDANKITQEGITNSTLNALGVQDWELIAIVPTQQRNQPVGVFKKGGVGPVTMTVTALDPPQAELGQPGFTLRVLGESFTPTAEIVISDIPVPTTFVSMAELTADLTMTNITGPGEHPVTVRDPAVPMGAGVQAAVEPVMFVVTGTLAPTPPVLTSLEPDTVELGQPSFTLRILGTGFTPESILVWNGSDDVCAFVSDTEVTTTVNMATAEVAVTVSVEVRNGELISNSMAFVFTEAPPPDEINVDLPS